MTPDNPRELIAEANQYFLNNADSGLAGPDLVHRLATALAVLSAPQEGDAEDALAYLITAHRFKERGLRGAIMEPDIAIARPLARFLLSEGFSRAAVPEPEWEYARQNRYGNVCEPDDSREQAEYRASLGGGYDTVVRRPLVWWEPLPAGGDQDVNDHD